MATLSVARTSTSSRVRQALVPMAAVVAILTWGGLTYVSSGRDDAHITYWAARTLADRGAILNYNQNYVEQSSSLLHVLILAGLSRITGVSLPDLGLALSIVGGAVAVVGAWLLARRIAPQRAWVAPFLLVAVPYLPYWSFGQLETTLAAALMSLLLVALSGALTPPRPGVDAMLAVLCTAYVLIRPEGAVVLLTGTALAAACLWWHDRRLSAEHEAAWRRPAVIVALAASATLTVVTLWRFWYFGRLVPQSVGAKAGGVDLDTLRDGLSYLAQSISWLPTLLGLAILLVLGLGGTLRARRPEPNRALATLVFMSAFITAQLSFAVATGGDWMEGARFLVPVLPLLAAGAARGLVHLPSRGGTAVTAALFMCGIAQTLFFTMSSSTGTPLPGVVEQQALVQRALGRNEAWVSWPEWANRVNLRDVPLVAALDPYLRTLLHSTGKLRLAVLSGQMGMVPYHLAGRFPGAIRFIDLRGLVTRDLTDCPVTADRHRGRGGLVGLSYGRALKMRGELAAACGIPEPDLVFGPSTPGRLREIADAGYAIVYQQQGPIDATLGLGAPRSIDAFIAVRRDLVTAALDDLPRSLTLGATSGQDSGVTRRQAPPDE